MMTDLISVIVPVYKVANDLPRCLDSILEQTYPYIEIIAVDDGSPDNSSTILDAYAQKDARLRVIHKENGGVTSARLRGVQEAHGEWIGFVDGDDMIEPDMFARLLDNAHKYHADIAHCGYQRVFPNGRRDLVYGTGRIVEQDRQTGLKDLLTGAFVEPGLCNKLFYKHLFHGLLHDSVMDTSIKINEDLLMNYYLFKAAKRAVYEDVCPYLYMLRENSASQAKVNIHKLLDPARVSRIIAEDVKDDPVLSAVVTTRLAHQLIDLSTMTLGRDRALIAPIRKNARKELRAMLSDILRECGVRMKVQCLWAACLPASYHLVHALYARAAGIDKKFSVN